MDNTCILVHTLFTGDIKIMQHIDAKAIAENLLQRTGVAIEAGDFEEFSDCFSLPLEVVSSERQINVTDLSQLREIFQGVSWNRLKQSKGCVFREVVYANWFAGQDIYSVHVQFSSLKGRKGHFSQLKCLSRLVFSNDRWKINSTTYVEEDPIGQYAALFRLADNIIEQHYSPDNKDNKLCHIVD